MASSSIQHSEATQDDEEGVAKQWNWAPVAATDLEGLESSLDGPADLECMEDEEKPQTESTIPKPIKVATISLQELADMQGQQKMLVYEYCHAAHIYRGRKKKHLDEKAFRHPAYLVFLLGNAGRTCWCVIRRSKRKEKDPNFWMAFKTANVLTEKTPQVKGGFWLLGARGETVRSV